MKLAISSDVAPVREIMLLPSSRAAAMFRPLRSPASNAPPRKYRRTPRCSDAERSGRACVRAATQVSANFVRIGRRRWTIAAGVSAATGGGGGGDSVGGWAAGAAAVSGGGGGGATAAVSAVGAGLASSSAGAGVSASNDGGASMLASNSSRYLGAGRAGIGAGLE